MRVSGGFSGMFPTSGWAFRLAAGIVIGSVVNALLTKSGNGHWLPLFPESVLKHFMLWQPFTYAFVEVSPLGVIFGALIMWSIGTALEQTWGGKRVAMFAFFTTVISAVLTVLLSLIVTDLRGGGFPGGTVMTSSVWVAYGWAFGKRQTNFWGMPVTGNMFAGIGILFVVLNAIMGSWLLVVPSVFGILIAYYYVHFGSPFEFVTRLRGWMLQRKLRSKSKHLRVVGKDRNIGGGSDQYLH